MKTNYYKIDSAYIKGPVKEPSPLNTRWQFDPNVGPEGIL